MSTPEAVTPAGSRSLPEWIRIHPPNGPRYDGVKTLLHGLQLETVCREARCPNLPECWSAGTATLMLLGAECTRRCSFCAVTTHWPHGTVDATEPDRVARAVQGWGLRYVVLTQVCRDDLADGGASLLAETVRQIRRASPTTKVELLAGDLGGTPPRSPRSWRRLRRSSPTTSKRSGPSLPPFGTTAPGTTGRWKCFVAPARSGARAWC